MTGHTNWEDLKRAEGVTWTGYNITEVEEFANRASFAFTVGSYRLNKKPPGYRWIAWLAAKLETISLGGEDKTTLEIYPDRKGSEAETSREKAKLDRALIELEGALGPVDPKMLAEARRIFNEIDDVEYTPWHWTTAHPGDKILRDGSVVRVDGTVTRPV